MKVIKNLTNGKLVLNGGRYVIAKGEVGYLHSEDEASEGVKTAVIRGWASIEERDESDMPKLIVANKEIEMWPVERIEAKSAFSAKPLENKTVATPSLDEMAGREPEAPVKKERGARKTKFAPEDLVVPEDPKKE